MGPKPLFEPALVANATPVGNFLGIPFNPTQPAQEDPLLPNYNPTIADPSSSIRSAVFYCFEDQLVGEAAHLMEEQQVRRLVILNRDKRLVGIVSLGDLAVETGDEQLAGKALRHCGNGVDRIGNGHRDLGDGESGMEQGFGHRHGGVGARGADDGDDADLAQL